MLAKAMDLARGNFLSGWKAYILLWGLIVLTWIGFAIGVDLVCVWSGGAEASCAPPTAEEAAKTTWYALAGIAGRKAIPSVLPMPIEDGPLTGEDPRG